MRGQSSWGRRGEPGGMGGCEERRAEIRCVLSRATVAAMFRQTAGR